MASTARILIVDDEPHVRAMLGATLERHSYQTVLAGSNAEAFELIDRQHFDLVLTDMVMRDGNGIGLLERIHLAQPQTPVVMVTAIQDISVAITAMRSGAYDYLLKPFERDQLLATVRRALENRRLKIENLTYQNNLEALVAARTEILKKTNADLEVAMHRLERSYNLTLEALGDALDLKD